ncbi:MAG: membrane protein insertion efficiency factor YidD [Erythrobacter sp.]|nr:membrane protein insertion efficiency factor YidD [Erythrobacter sp.]
METHGVTRLLILFIRFYQRWLSPLTGPHCRFQPSCSAYAAEALARHGLLRGGTLSLWRLLRCNPWGGSGYDPVPPLKPKGLNAE